MKISRVLIDRLKDSTEPIPLPMESRHGWRSSPDEGGHTHCESCKTTIYLGDPVVGCYLKFVSVVFCPECVRDNPELFRKWLTNDSI